MGETYVCGVCGKAHAGLSTDQAYKLPDEVWAIPEQERSERAKFNSDLCRYDGRYFIRCVLHVPFTDNAGDFGWGVWVEVDWPIFERYVALFETDGSDEPRYAGKLANALPAYTETLGANVLVQFRQSTQRPSVHLPDDDDSQLALEQRHGIDGARYHDILAAVEIPS
jgi:hypothetical protein